MRIRDSIRRSDGNGSIHAIVHGQIVCVHEEEEQEPGPVRGKPIISVNGKDVSTPWRDERPAKKRKRAA